MQPAGDGHASPPAPAVLPLMGAVAAAILESQRTLGCSRCRFAKGGCRRCRNPDFKPRGSPTGAAARAAAPAAPAVSRRIKGKRQRKAESAGPPEPLLHTLRRQLASLQADSEGTAPQPGASADSDSTAAAASDAAQEAPAGAVGAEAGAPAQQQQQQLKRAAEGGRSDRPAKYLRADPQLVSSLQQQQRQQGGAPAASAAAAKRGASSDPSPSTRRPTKRQRALSVAAAERAEQAEEDAVRGACAAEAAAGESAVEEAAGQAAAQGKRAAAAQQAQRPPKFRRVAPPSPVPRQPLAQADQARAAGPGGSPGQAGAAGPGGSPGQGLEGMDVDLVSPRKRAAAAALERAAAAGASPTSAAFMAQLEQNMQRRHEERQAGASPHPLASAGEGKRHRAGSAPSSPAGVAGPAAAAAAEELDPRLCLWEPPVSPFGLLEEELYDDPWKLLVACLLLNKTSATQVRRVIWDLFALCPTPAAAVAADVQRIQALITPLGLFRKRALAIQQLSQDYLYKQWREPTELFGVGRYGADAYRMFCRGAWREVAPDDKDLRRYRDWLEATGGLGTGLTRHRTMPVASGRAG